MSEFPVLVPCSRWDAETASALACEECGFTRGATGDEIGAAEPGLPCEREGCDGFLDWKYQLADECGGCGKLGYFPKVLGGCCSRVCQLQAEYAAELAKRKGAAA